MTAEYATCDYCGDHDYSRSERDWSYRCEPCQALPLVDACDNCGEYRGPSALLLQVEAFERRNSPYPWPEARTQIIPSCDVCAPVGVR